MRLFTTNDDAKQLLLGQIIEFRTGFNRYNSTKNETASIVAASETFQFKIVNSNVVKPQFTIRVNANAISLVSSISVVMISLLTA
jgi:hypothetical protein